MIVKIELEKKDAVWIRNRLYDFADWIGVSDEHKRKIHYYIKKIDKAIKGTNNDKKSST